MLRPSSSKRYLRELAKPETTSILVKVLSAPSPAALKQRIAARTR